MTSFTSIQDSPYTEIKQYNVSSENNTYRDLFPVEPTISHTTTYQPPKVYSFGDNIDGHDALKPKSQTVITTSTEFKAASLEPTHINSRLDQLLKNAESVLARSKQREGSISAYQPIATAPVTEFDSGLSLNSAEVQRRTAFDTTPSAIPQTYTTQPLDIDSGLSLTSADLYKKTPVTLTPNATSYRSPMNFDIQNTEYSLGSAEIQKRAGLDSAALKYSPIQYTSQTYESDLIGASTKRSLLTGYETAQPQLYSENLPITSTTTTPYETTNYAKTIPRSYDLFPIKESERSTYVSQVEPTNHEVQALKSGISNIEDLLRTLNHTPAMAQTQTISTTNYANQDLYTRPNHLDTYGDATPNFSATSSLKTKDFDYATEQPKKTFSATATDFTTNYYQPTTYSRTPEREERGRTLLSHERSYEPKEQTDQALKNIDDLMQRHLFEKSPLRKSPISQRQTLRYMSPTRAEGSPNPHLQNYETQRHWELIDRSAEASYQPYTAVEKEHRANPDLYRRSSLQTTPTPAPKELYQDYQLKPSQTYSQYGSETKYITKTPNTHSPMTKDVNLSKTYGSVTNYKEYYSPKTEKFQYKPSSGTSPYSPYQYETYERPNKSYLQANPPYAGNEQYEGIAERYQDYGNQDILNSADRKMKKLTLRAKSNEDSERKEGNRHTPSGKRDIHDDIFSENDNSQFDFHNSGHDIGNTHDSNRKVSPQAIPNTFKAGELIPDREEAIQREGVYNKFNSGNLQHDPNVFNSEELQHDYNDPHAFKAGELQNDRDERNSPLKSQKAHQPLKGDHGVDDENKQSFRSGDLQQDNQSPEKVPRSKNVADDGKAWQMVHRVNSQMLDSPDHSFDFDAENVKYQQQVEEAVKMSHQRPRVQESKPQQRIVDPHLWVVDVPQNEVANLSKSSQGLKQSVKKAQRKPIIAYCFEKFENKNFSATQ